MAMAMAITFPQLCFAARINAVAAEAKAVSFLNGRSVVKGGDRKSLSVTRHKLKLTPASAETSEDFYIFNRDGSRAFVIVSGSDLLPEIVGYSDSEALDGDNVPPALKAYLSDYSKLVEAAENGAVLELSASAAGEAVEPLMNTKWNQSAPYNDLTPTVSGVQAPSGCVATAVAQVMYYHRYPSRGHGKVSNSGNTVELGHEYDWDNMKPVYEKGGYTEQEGAAIATLMRDVGYAVNMDYGAEESGAFSEDISIGLCRHFNYSTDAEILFRTSCTTDYWLRTIRESLLRGEPLPLAGTSTGRNASAHQFVCDGIDENGLLHINWGWGGVSDGYFDMNILSPDNLGIGAGEGAYYARQSIVLNLRPGDETADQSEFTGKLSLSDVSVSSKVNESGELVDDYLSISSNINNCSGTILSDVNFGLMVRDDAGNIRDIRRYDGLRTFPAPYYKGFSPNLRTDGLIADGTLTDGHYRVSIIYSVGSELTASNFTYPGSGNLNEIGFTVRGGRVILDNPDLAQKTVSQYTLLSVSAATAYAHCDAGIPVVGRIRSSAVRGENKSFGIYLIPEDEYSDQVSLSDYKNVGSVNGYFYDGDITVSGTVSTVGIKSGNYVLCLGYYNAYEKKSMAIPATEKNIITVLPQPEEGMAILKPFEYTPDVVKRNENQYLGFLLIYHYFYGDMLKSRLELWACPENGSEADEFLVSEIDPFYFYSGNRRTDLDFWSGKSLWDKELGRYEAYLKCKDVRGRMRRIPGSCNGFVFELVEDDDIFRLVSPVKFNHGDEIVFDGSQTLDFELEFDLAINTAREIDTKLSPEVYVSTDAAGENRCYTMALRELDFGTGVFAPGEPVNCKASIRIYSISEDLYGKPLYLQFNSIPVKMKEGEVGWSARRVQMLPYGESAVFTVVKTSGVDNVAADGCDGPFEVFSLDGRRIPVGVASESELNSVLEPGVYVLRRGSRTAKILVP